MKVYISIPITGLDYETQQAKADKYAQYIYEMGHDYFNPFSVPAPATAEPDTKEATAYYMGEDVRELLKCDAVYMAKGWENSKGCKVEKFIATNLFTTR